MDFSLTWSGPVAVATWNDGENRINTDSLGAFNAILDDVVATTGPRALVLTGAGKFFSNGLDLDRFADDQEEFSLTFKGLERLMGRLLVLPCYTISAINGHAFAGGAMIASAFDWRIMRADRGFWCLNEVDIGIPLTDEMYAGICAHLPQSTIAEALLTGRRFSGDEALAAGVATELATEETLLASAVDRAAQMADKDPKVFAIHKRHLYGELARRCGFDD